CRSHVLKGDVKAILISSPKNREYLSGFDGSAGWLLVTPSQHFLITDGRYWDQVARQAPGAELFRFVPSQHDTLSGALATLITELGLLRLTDVVGVETDGLLLSVFR